MDCDPSEPSDKKKGAKELITSYYFQLTKGCGRQSCDNPHCASSGQLSASLSPDQAAARAIQCVRVSSIVISPQFNH